ncbi:MAG: hypothetical protein ACOCZK_01575 [Planctomycetota bacterium]
MRILPVLLTLATVASAPAFDPGPPPRSLPAPRIAPVDAATPDPTLALPPLTRDQALAICRSLQHMRQEQPALHARLDSSGDQRLDADELHGLAGQRADELVALIDSDGDAALDATEIDHALAVADATKAEERAASAAALATERPVPLAPVASRLTIGSARRCVVDYDVVDGHYDPVVRWLPSGSGVSVSGGSVAFWHTPTCRPRVIRRRVVPRTQIRRRVVPRSRPSPQAPRRVVRPLER